MTPAQLAAARAVREEVEFAWGDVMSLAATEAAISEYCKACGLPPLPVDTLKGICALQLALLDVIHQYDEILAASAGSGAAGAAAAVRPAAHVAAPALEAA